MTCTCYWSFQAPAYLLDKPLRDLVRYLISPTRTQLGKVRAIFRWIAAQNLTELSGSAASGPPQTPTDYLLRIKNRTTSYQTLMQDMCRFIHTVFCPVLPRDVKKGKGRALVIAPQVYTAATEALRYMARTKQRRTYLPYTFPTIAGRPTHLPTPRGWRVE